MIAVEKLDLKELENGELITRLGMIAKSMQILCDLQDEDLFDVEDARVAKLYLLKSIEMIEELLTRTGEDALNEKQVAGFTNFLARIQESELYAFSG